MAIKVIKNPKTMHQVFQITCSCGCVFECDETDIDVSKSKDYPLEYVYGTVECPHCKKTNSASTRNMVFNEGLMPGTSRDGITSFGREVGYSPDGKPVERKPRPDVFVDEDKLNSII